ncbi:MAG: TonB-dependent receptor family protein [Muribaculaceae bacterium]|nr:TonB-dependent receptor family protein [Muribaculaceae bacterium]
MSRFIISSLLIIFSHSFLHSIVVKGIVIDIDSVPIEFANIAAFANDTVKCGGMTDGNGVFRLEIEPDCNKIRVSSVGYDDAVLSPIRSDMGKIILRQNSTTLKEIVVKAPLIRREADRIVLNIEANPLAANKDAQQLLKTAPGVWATDDRLSIYGQSGTIVYVDDRKVNMSGNQLMTYLKSIQSSSISSIEIIPKAGAEYSADSSGGIIKINLRRNRIDGYNGTTGLNVTAGEYKQWINPFINLGLRWGRWTANFTGSLNGTPSDRYTSYEEMTNTAFDNEMTGVSHHKNKEIQGNASLGVFYEPSERDKIGIQFDYNSSKSRHISNSETEQYFEEFKGMTFGSYNSHDRFHNFNLTFNWTHNLDNKGSAVKLISNYNYQNSSVAEDDAMRWSYLLNDSIYRTDSHNRYNVFVTDLSFNKVFNQNWKLSIGANYTLNNVSNSSFHKYMSNQSWTLNRKYDYNVLYYENIAGGFVAANGRAGRWKFKLGLRGEYSDTRGEIANKASIDLFPNVNVSYCLTEKEDYIVAAGYYRNIRRPSFQSLNPVVRQVSDYTYMAGNPSLTRSLTDAFSLDFILAGRFTIAAGYSMTDNPIRQMFSSNPDYPERLYLTWGNEGKDRNTFIHGDGFINITKWWNLYSSLTYMITSQKLKDTGSFDKFSYLRFVASTTFMLPKGFNLTMNCFYNSKMKIGNITVYPILNINPTLQKQFGNHWSVSIDLEDILQRRSKIRTESSGINRFSFTKMYMTARIGVTYKFNTGKSFRHPRIEKKTDNSRFIKE